MSESKFRDCWGRELQVETCEYCGVTKPVSHWISIADAKDEYNFLMIQYIGRDGREAWMCKECYMDMENKTERKINQ
jgi:NMD protein affecting ribosome stability and mRNA decay